MLLKVAMFLLPSSLLGWLSNWICFAATYHDKSFFRFYLNLIAVRHFDLIADRTSEFQTTSGPKFSTYPLSIASPSLNNAGSAGYNTPSSEPSSEAFEYRQGTMNSMPLALSLDTSADAFLESPSRTIAMICRRSSSLKKNQLDNEWGGTSTDVSSKSALTRNRTTTMYNQSSCLMHLLHVDFDFISIFRTCFDAASSSSSSSHRRRPLHSRPRTEISYGFFAVADAVAATLHCRAVHVMGEHPSLLSGCASTRVYVREAADDWIFLRSYLGFSYVHTDSS